VQEQLAAAPSDVTSRLDGFHPEAPAVCAMSGASPRTETDGVSLGKPTRIVIQNNPTLTLVRVPGTSDSAGDIHILGNPQLSELDLSPFRNITRLQTRAAARAGRPPRLTRASDG
jgi:hypothetical protein